MKRVLMIAALLGLGGGMVACGGIGEIGGLPPQPEKVQTYFLEKPGELPKAEVRANDIRYYTNRPLTFCRIENKVVVEDNVYPTGDATKPGKTVAVEGITISAVYKCPTQRAEGTPITSK